MQRLLLSIAIGVAVMTAPACAADPKLTYKSVFSTKLPFGGKVAEAYIPGSFDVDGDGAEDFAVTGLAREDAKNTILHSFIVRNDAAGKNLQVTDLGDDGLTRNTSGATFFREADGATYFVLGRNGELFAPGVGRNEPESFSIFSVSGTETGLAAQTVFVSAEHALTASVETCDVDHDGTTEILVNNYTDYQARIVRREDGTFHEYPAKQWVFMLLNAGAHNSLNFADVDGDGWCDMLAAYEVPNPKTFGPPGVFQSFVSLNAGGRIGKSPMMLPNPAFGKHHAGFDIRSITVGGEALVFLTAAEFTGFSRDGWNKYQMQVFRLENNAFVEVTKDKLNKQLPIDYAGQKDIRFQDIDNDGDPDIYLSSYTDEIVIYRNKGGKFVAETVRKADGRRHKAVAFLDNPLSKCPDMVVATPDGKLERFECQ